MRRVDLQPTYSTWLKYQSICSESLCMSLIHPLCRTITRRGDSAVMAFCCFSITSRVRYPAAEALIPMGVECSETLACFVFSFSFACTLLNPKRSNLTWSLPAATALLCDFWDLKLPVITVDFFSSCDIGVILPRA